MDDGCLVCVSVRLWMCVRVSVLVCVCKRFWGLVGVLIFFL